MTADHQQQEQPARAEGNGDVLCMAPSRGCVERVSMFADGADIGCWHQT